MVQTFIERGSNDMKVAVIGAKGQLGQDIIKVAPKNVILKAFTHQDLDITNKEDVIDF